jgi:glycosyltransferase involved in cell wall biosynthesis
MNTDKKMDVCVLIFSYPSLSETFVRKHVEGLNATVIAENINSDLLNSSNTSINSIALETPFIDNALSPLKRTIQFAIRHILHAGTYNSTQKTKEVLKRTLVELKPDAILVEFGHLAVAVLPVLRELKIPFIVHFHGMDLSVCWKQIGYRRQLSELVKFASGLVVVNKRVQEIRLRKCGCPEEKIHCIPCGACIETIKPRSYVADRHIRFLSASRLVKVKGPLYTLKAFRRCNRLYPETTLTMVGDGPMVRECKKFIRKYDLTNSVRMLGALPHEEVLVQMQKATIFLQHSIVTAKGDEEGWPVTIAEAQGAGLAVVSTCSGGIPENVLDGKSGFLVEERDWQAMADCMLKLAQNPELCYKMGEIGRSHMLQNGDADKQLKKLAEVLKSFCISTKN